MRSMVNCLSIIVIYAIMASTLVDADDSCPPFLPVEDSKVEADIQAKAEGLKSLIASGDLKAAVKKESSAVYTAGGDISYKQIEYTMIATVCRFVRDDKNLSGEKKARIVAELQKEAMTSKARPTPAINPYSWQMTSPIRLNVGNPGDMCKCWLVGGDRGPEDQGGKYCAHVRSGVDNPPCDNWQPCPSGLAVDANGVASADPEGANPYTDNAYRCWYRCTCEPAPVSAAD